MTAPVSPGDVIAEKYRVERVLGEGGMGVVVEALHLDLDKRFAVKFLLPEALDNEDAVVRFSREARAAARLQSEHVVRVVDTGKLESGAPFMVMEYLEGEDLADHLGERGPLREELAVDYLLQALEAVAEAHSLGIVHRDLKPQNLFLTRRPDGSRLVKVLDFGISKLTGPESDSTRQLTKTSTTMGSPYFMSPEQMRRTRSVDHRTDIWALGVILYTMLTTKYPFEGETLHEYICALITDPPIPLQDIRQDLSPTMHEVVRRCLEKNREERFATVAELAEALAPLAPDRSAPSVERIRRVVGDLPPASIPPGPSSDSAEGGPVPAVTARQIPRGGPTTSSWTQPTQPLGTAPTVAEEGGAGGWLRRWRLGLGGVGALVAVAIGVVLLRPMPAESLPAGAASADSALVAASAESAGSEQSPAPQVSPDPGQPAPAASAATPTPASAQPAPPSVTAAPAPAKRPARRAAARPSVPPTSTPSPAGRQLYRKDEFGGRR